MPEEEFQRAIIAMEWNKNIFQRGHQHDIHPLRHRRTEVGSLNFYRLVDNNRRIGTHYSAVGKIFFRILDVQ